MLLHVAVRAELCVAASAFVRLDVRMDAIVNFQHVLRRRPVRTVRAAESLFDVSQLVVAQRAPCFKTVAAGLEESSNGSLATRSEISPKDAPRKCMDARPCDFACAPLEHSFS